MDPAMTIFREAAGSSLFEGPTPVSVSSLSLPPLMYLTFASPSFFFSTLPFSTSEGTATLSSTTVKVAYVRGRGRIHRARYLFQVLLEFYWTVSRCNLARKNLFFLITLMSYCNYVVQRFRSIHILTD